MKGYAIVARPEQKVNEFLLGKKSRDARTPQPGEIVFNTMRYRNSEIVQRSGYIQSSVSYIKVPILLSRQLANLISKLNFYKLIPYPMDNCFTGRRDRSRQTPEKDVLYIIPAGPVSSVHSLGGASYLLPVQTE